MKHIKRLLKEGVNKNEIFDQAVHEGLNSKKVSRYLARYPDPEESKKYNLINNIVVVIYVIAILLSIPATYCTFYHLAALYYSDPFHISITGLVAVLFLKFFISHCIYKKIAGGYILMSLLNVIGIFFMFDEILTYSSASPGIALVINIIFITCVVTLKKRLFPYQNFFHTAKDGSEVVAFTKDI